MKKLATVACCSPGAPPLKPKEFENLSARFKALSHHLKVLREAGLIEVAYRRGTYFFYRLVPEAVGALAFALGGAPQPEFVLATAEGTVAR
jgi:DNA-binding transcriptional ArsR family regulator